MTYKINQKHFSQYKENMKEDYATKIAIQKTIYFQNFSNFLVCQIHQICLPIIFVSIPISTILKLFKKTNLTRNQKETHYEK